MKTNIELSKTEQKKFIIKQAIEEYINTPLLDRSVKGIANKYGINGKTLSKYLKLEGVEIISNRNASHFNFNFFEKIDTEEKAYWLGFMYADGYVGAKNHFVGLSISLKDIEHLKKYNKALDYNKGLNIKESHQFGSKSKLNKLGETIYMVTTEIKNKKLHSDLIDKGCIPNKSLILHFPNEEIFNYDKFLILSFIRGYFDGDGTLGLYQHSKTNKTLEESLMFVGTKQFLEKIQDYLGQGFLMQKPNCSYKTYRLSYSTTKAFNVAKLIYENSTIYLQRKYDIYLKMCRNKIGQKRGTLR